MTREPCTVDGCPKTAVEDHELCVRHLHEAQRARAKAEGLDSSAMSRPIVSEDEFYAERPRTEAEAKAASEAARNALLAARIRTTTGGTTT